MNVLILLYFTFIFLVLEIVYFKIADRYNIVDKPNHRSSHTKVTIRGGGIIFSAAPLLAFSFFERQYPYFIVGLILVTLISFIDDIMNVKNKIKFVCHFIGVALLFWQLDIYNLPYYWIAAAFIFTVGTINAINFMDGINGITGIYCLITMVTLYYINQHVVVFIDERYLILSILSLLVFTFFNFRTTAKCFAGDVGSVSIAFILVFFILLLVVKTSNPGYFLLLLMYGLDTAITLIFRIFRKENIFEAHKSHFYQFWVNEKGASHLTVASVYGFIQILINYILITAFQLSIISLIISVSVPAIIFILIRLYFERNRVLPKSEEQYVQL